MDILDVISPSKARPPAAGDDEDEVEFGVAPPHAALNTAIRRSARKGTARRE
jgi:hypothetical protein